MKEALILAITISISIIFMIAAIIFIYCCLVISSWRDKDERQD